MKENKENTAQDWVDPDEIPDLSAPEWDNVIATASISRGRPKLATPKVSTTIRLDPDVVEHLKASGKGWQTRANALLREALEL